MPDLVTLAQCVRAMAEESQSGHDPDCSDLFQLADDLSALSTSPAPPREDVPGVARARELLSAAQRHASNWADRNSDASLIASLLAEADEELAALNSAQEDVPENAPREIVQHLCRSCHQPGPCDCPPQDRTPRIEVVYAPRCQQDVPGEAVTLYRCDECGRHFDAMPTGCDGEVGGNWHIWVPGSRDLSDQHPTKRVQPVQYVPARPAEECPTVCPTCERRRENPAPTCRSPYHSIGHKPESGEEPS